MLCDKPQALLRVRASSSLGSVNPVPFLFMPVLFSAVTVYGVALKAYSLIPVRRPPPPGAFVC